jgi:hypothetical protein
MIMGFEIFWPRYLPTRYFVFGDRADASQNARPRKQFRNGHFRPNRRPINGEPHAYYPRTLFQELVLFVPGLEMESLNRLTKRHGFGVRVARQQSSKFFVQGGDRGCGNRNRDSLVVDCYRTHVRPPKILRVIDIQPVSAGRDGHLDLGLEARKTFEFSIPKGLGVVSYRHI